MLVLQEAVQDGGKLKSPDDEMSTWGTQYPPQGGASRGGDRRGPPPARASGGAGGLYPSQMLPST